MMEEEPSRYRSLAGATAYGEYPLDLQTLVDTKQCEEPELMSTHKWELNPAATRCTKDGHRVRPTSRVGKLVRSPEGEIKSTESKDILRST
jgi:hypothetical protein